MTDTGTVSVRKILLVEDDQFKQELIEMHVRQIVERLVISVGRSVQRAVELVRADVYDLIILDIALPSHESRLGGAQPMSQPSGGVEVLLELAYDQRTDPVIIMTQYPEIEFDGSLYTLGRFRKAVDSQITANVVGVVHFNAQSDAWRAALSEAVK